MEKRDRETLEEVIVRRVRPGTRVLTDGWKAYHHLNEIGYTWAWVNHSKNFRKPEDHTVHTNTVEGLWFVVKRTLPRSGSFDLASYLPVFMWMRKTKKEEKDPFVELLKLIAWRQENDQEEEEEQPNIPEADLPPTGAPSCLFCGKSFDSLAKKKDHMKDCESGKQLKMNHPCLFCGKSFPTKKGKTTHMNTCKPKTT